MARRTQGDEKFKFAQLTAAQGERDGVFKLGCYRDGKGCEKNLDKAKENFLCASELGHVLAMRCLGDLFDESDPEWWRWWGLASALGDSSWFLLKFAKQVELFNSGSGSAADCPLKLLLLSMSGPEGKWEVNVLRVDDLDHAEAPNSVVIKLRRPQCHYRVLSHQVLRM